MPWDGEWMKGGGGREKYIDCVLFCSLLGNFTSKIAQELACTFKAETGTYMCYSNIIHSLMFHRSTLAPIR